MLMFSRGICLETQYLQKNFNSTNINLTRSTPKHIYLFLAKTFTLIKNDFDYLKYDFKIKLI